MPKLYCLEGSFLSAHTSVEISSNRFVAFILFLEFVGAVSNAVTVGTCQVTPKIKKDPISNSSDFRFNIFEPRYCIPIVPPNITRPSSPRYAVIGTEHELHKQLPLQAAGQDAANPPAPASGATPPA